MDDIDTYLGPDREARCPACRLRGADRLDHPAAHTCRRPPATPQAVRDDHARAAAALHLERELRIRRERLVEINARLA